MSRSEYMRKWTRENREKTNEYRRKNYRQTQDAPRSRMAWTQEEDKAILRRDKTDREVSQEIGRSVQAIQLRRHRISPNQEK